MYAFCIIDINHRNVDRSFTYLVPEALRQEVKPGSRVLVPFGRRDTVRQAFVLRTSDRCEVPDDKLKEILSLAPKAKNVEQDLVSLAVWMRERYGGTLYQCLSVVLPAKADVQTRKARFLVLKASREELESALDAARKKKYYARERLLEAFENEPVLPYQIVSERLNVTAKTMKPYLESGLFEIRESRPRSVGNEVSEASEAERARTRGMVLNEDQEKAVKTILEDERQVQVLFGITGSGKTEVYLELISRILSEGKEAIVLIPEISLTYQTVMRFYARFGELVSVVHSRLSKGEKAERFDMAKKGQIRVMIGPRSALFTPFQHLGLIIIDEFHDSSYDSEQIPKYNAIETAIERSRITGSKTVLGSATPSVSVYRKAVEGSYGLVRLRNRAVSGSMLPKTSLTDMRRELRHGNRSIFSKTLLEKLSACLERGEQAMLFLNRRGYSGAVSCRSCGEALLCPHCSIPLSFHRGNRLKCHICGYERNMVDACPSCGSKLIGAFGAGTEKVEQSLKEQFPGVRTLRMDADTTASKDAHYKIIEAFRNGQADVLIGTQMIVKGHDFDRVTLVGILAADLSLFVPDYRSAERTFQLLVQAMGRAGRRKNEGECVIQTYNPEHYAVECAVRQDFEAFYESECLFRKEMNYPPFGSFIGLRIYGPDPENCRTVIEKIASALRTEYPDLEILGPAEDGPFKVRDQYRYICYLKSAGLEHLLDAKNRAENLFDSLCGSRQVYLSFEN